MTRTPASGSLDQDQVVIAPGSLSGELDFARIFGRADVRPVELELGFGKGSFLLELARRSPDRDVLGVERARPLVRKVRDRAIREGARNVRLLHADAKDVVGRLLPAGSIARVHVCFPDPWPKRRHAKHRLFSPPFPDDLARALAPRGVLLLSTDHDPYFRSVVAALALHPLFVRVTPDAFAGLPTTGFERIFASQGIPIFRGAWERVDESLLAP